MEAAAETALWLYDKIPLIKAYLDGPKSLEELQREVGKPEEGYDVHHIVEQTPARDHKEIPDALIDGPDNLVRVPRLKHWEITGWFMRGNNKKLIMVEVHRVNILGARDGKRGGELAWTPLLDFKVLKP